ncbi:MAG: NAD(P)-dependent glycerol-1-phosphate dehydrogenase [Candidatus Syntropharchaeia archaeon]
MELPREIVVGHDAILNVGDVCKKLKLSGTALIVADSLTKKIAGETVEEILFDAGYNVQISEIDSSNDYEIEKTKEIAEETNADFMLGVGGGKSIDVAKLASTEERIPFLSIPTAASHDGIVSHRASIKRGGKPVSVEAQAPIAVIADTGIIASAPYRLTAAGCGDIISNYTAVKDWELARKLRNTPYSEYAAALSLMTAKIIVDSCDLIKPGLEESARIVVKALVSSGVAMSIAGSSAPASGSEHKFSHALDRIAPEPALHGEQCGVGCIMMMYLHGGDWEKIRDSLKKIGAPTDAKGLNIDEEYIVEALVRAHEINPDRYTILGTGLTREAAEKLASVTGVI